MLYANQVVVARQLRPIGDPYVTLAASSGDSVEGTQSAAHRLENIKDLIRAFPELQPAGSLLPGLALTSETVNQITSNHDPAVSGLLAVGQASYLNSHRNTKAVPIFAVAGGLGGESVRLVVLRQEHLGWKGERNVYLDNFSSRSREESFWEGKGSPVQQLVFAELNGQSSDWLAVRYQGAVSILRPRLRTDNSASISQSTGGLKTRLDPNPIVTLDIERLGGIAFADVAFNPWNHQQIASIDQESHWIVWNIIGIGRKRGLWTIEKESGEYVTNIREGEEQSHAQGDGWGIVLWAGSASRLVAASRRDLAIFDIKKVVTRLDVPNLLSRNPTDWILDIKRKPSDNTCIFVATSSTLYYVNVHMSNDLKQPGAQCLLSWNHFIDPEDISLRLYVPHVPDDSHHRFASAGTLL